MLLNAFQIEASENITLDEYNSAIRKKWMQALSVANGLQSNYFSSFAKIEDSIKIKIDYHFVNSTFSKELYNCIEKEPVTVVVITVYKAGKFFKKIQDTIEKVTHDYKIPVLIVPENSQPKTIKNIVFATNFNKLQNNKSFEMVTRLGEIFNANIHFIHLSSDSKPEEITNSLYKQKIETLIKANSNFKFRNIYGTERLQTLDDYLKENKIDILYTRLSSQNFIERLFNPSGEIDLYMHSSIAVWLEYHE